MTMVESLTAFITIHTKIRDQAIAREREWIDDLKSRGFKAAHPNDS